jgi:soluble lytic murein transglycosylase-like protein
MPTNINEKIKKNKRIGTIAATALGVSVAVGGAATALAGGLSAPQPLQLSGKTTLERSVEAHASRRHYRHVYDDAKKLRIEPKRNLADGVARTPELKAGAAALSVEVTGEKAKRKAEEKKKQKEAADAASAYGTPASVGVDQATLDSIAACESGGDPTAIDPSGTYRGKYQFDMGTWASVGGSGDPAAAPEAEQDYRAALLLSQSGSSPWPVCGS